MNIVKIYIEIDGIYESLDVYTDENISLNSSVQNIKDLSKTYTDFIQSFSVPSSPNNNRIFKHYYNINIENGFDARVNKNAKLELNNIPFKTGKIKLDKVIIKNGKATHYKITFIGDIIKLTDLFGDDTLNNLPLDSFATTYDHSTVKSLMSGNTDVIYPLISLNRDWRWNTYNVVDGNHTTNLSPDDIRYDSVLATADDFISTGIKYTELRPALRLMRLIEAIESKYSITFSRDFFNTGSSFNDLYMWGNRDDKTVGRKATGDWQTITLNGQSIWELYVDGGYYDGIEFDEYALTITLLPGYTDIPFGIKVDGQIKEDIDGSGGPVAVTLSTLSLYSPDEKQFTIQIRADEIIEYNISLVRTYRENRLQGGSFDTIIDYGNEDKITENGQMYLSDIGDGTGIGEAGAMPKLKVKDFISGLINMYNLIIEPISENNFRIQNLNDWYADGNIQDISEYINKDSVIISRPKLNDSITFKYEDTETIIGKQFRDSSKSGSGYGDLKFEPDFEGSPLEIKIPFENIVGERLSDEKTKAITDIHIHKAISIDNNGKTSSVKTKPFIFYNNANYTPEAGPIQLNNGGTAEPLYTYNVASQYNNINQSNINESLNFGVEINSFTLIQPPSSIGGRGQYSLFNNYWKDYIVDLYNSKRRIFTYEGKLPLGIIKDINLNNKLVIDDTRFIINNIKILLNTGDVNLELLNDIYENDETLAAHAAINASSSRLTCSSPTVTLNGAPSTGVDLSYVWSTSGGTITGGLSGQTAVVTSAGTYTLTVTDIDGLTDNTTYTVSDSRITPSLIITGSSTEISYQIPTIILSSSITSGYGYNWYTPNGNIVSGNTSNQILINKAGTYYLDVIQNNTGCAASDSIVITSGDLEVPSTPTGLYSTGITESTLTLLWTPSTDDVAVQDYDVYKDGIYYATTTVPTQNIIGLLTGTTYQFKVLARDTSGNVSPFSEFYYQRTGSTSGADGADGQDAKAVKLIAATYVIEYDINGFNPSPSTILLTAKSQNVGTPWFKFTGDGITDDVLFSAGTGDTRTIIFTSPTSNNDVNEIRVGVSDGNQSEVGYDTISIASVFPGSGGYTVILSNDSHTLPTTNTGTISYGGSGTEIIVYNGGTQLSGITAGTPSVGQFKLVSATGTNITVGSITTGLPFTIGNHNSMTSDLAKIIYVLDLENNQTVNKIQTFAKSIEGIDGSAGLNSKACKLSANQYVITYDGTGAESPAQSIILSASSQNHVGTVYYEFLRNGILKQNGISTTYTIPDGDEPIAGGVVNYTLNTRESFFGTIQAIDNISITGIKEGADGSDGLGAISVILSNDAHTLPTTSAGVVTYIGSNTKIYCYEGNTGLEYITTTSPIAGQWYYTALGVNITAGSVPGTDNGTFATTSLPSNMTANNAKIQYSIIGKRLNGSSFTIIKQQSFAKSIAGSNGTDGVDGIDGIDGTNGTDGLDSKVVVLTASKYVITYTSTGLESPAQSITLTALPQNHVGTVYYQFLKDGVSKQNSTTSTYTILDADEPIVNGSNTWSVVTREGSSGAAAIASDNISLYGVKSGTDGTDGTDGADAYTVILSNEAHVLPISSGVIDYGGSGTEIIVYKGATRLTGVLGAPTTGQYGVTATVTSGTITVGSESIDVNGKTVFGNHSGAGTTPITINYRIYIGGTSIYFDKIQNVTLAPAGATGSKTKSAFVYYQISQPSAPATPTASSYNFASNNFTSLTSNWATTPPTATGNGEYWYSSYYVTETTSGGETGVPTFIAPAKSFAFTELVTFTNLASTTGSTVINGGNITTGNIESNNYVSGTAPYSTSGTQINLTNGSITTVNFGIDSSGNASFNGDIEGGTIKIGSGFTVNSEGFLTANGGIFNGTINADSGSLGNWLFSDNTITSSNGQMSLDAISSSINLIDNDGINILSTTTGTTLPNPTDNQRINSTIPTTSTTKTVYGTTPPAPSYVYSSSFVYLDSNVNPIVVDTAPSINATFVASYNGNYTTTWKKTDTTSYVKAVISSGYIGFVSLFYNVIIKDVTAGNVIVGSSNYQSIGLDGYIGTDTTYVTPVEFIATFNATAGHTYAIFLRTQYQGYHNSIGTGSYVQVYSRPAGETMVTRLGNSGTVINAAGVQIASSISKYMNIDTSAYNTGSLVEIFGGLDVDTINGGVLTDFHATNGYQYLVGGTIIQWGFSTLSYGSTVIFPLTFPSACRYVGITSRRGGNGSNGSDYTFTVTSTSFNVYNDGGSNGFWWMAIGY